MGTTERQRKIISRWPPYDVTEETKANVDACLEALYGIRVATLRQLNMITGLSRWTLGEMMRKHAPFELISEPMKFYADGKWKSSQHTHVYSMDKKLVRYYETNRNVDDGFLSKEHSWSFVPRDIEHAVQATEIYATLCMAGYGHSITWLNSVQVGSYVYSILEERGLEKEKLPKTTLLGGIHTNNSSVNPTVWGMTVVNRSPRGFERVLQFTFPKNLNGIINPLLFISGSLIRETIPKLKSKAYSGFSNLCCLPYEWSIDHPQALGELLLGNKNHVMERWAEGYSSIGWQVERLFEDEEASSIEPYQWAAMSPEGEVELCDTTFGKSLSQAYELATTNRQAEGDKKYKRVLYVATESEKAAWESIPKITDGVHIEYRLINWPI